MPCVATSAHDQQDHNDGRDDAVTGLPHAMHPMCNLLYVQVISHVAHRFILPTSPEALPLLRLTAAARTAGCSESVSVLLLTAEPLHTSSASQVIDSGLWAARAKP